MKRLAWFSGGVILALAVSPLWAGRDDYQLLANEKTNWVSVSKLYKNTYTTEPAREKNWEFDAGFGIAIPQQKEVTSYAWPDYPLKGKIHNSFTVQGQVRYRISERVSAGLRLDYTLNHRLDVDETSGDYDGFTIENNIQILGLVPTLRWSTLQDEHTPYELYAAIGVGGYQIHQAVSLHYLGWEVAHAVNNDYYLGVTPALGFSYAVGEDGRIGIEAQYERIFVSGEDLAFLKPTLLLSYRF